MDIVKRKLMWVNPNVHTSSFKNPGALTSSFVLVIGGSISRSFLMACNGGSNKGALHPSFQGS